MCIVDLSVSVLGGETRQANLRLTFARRLMSDSAMPALAGSVLGRRGDITVRGKVEPPFGSGAHNQPDWQLVVMAGAELVGPDLADAIDARDELMALLVGWLKDSGAFSDTVDVNSVGLVLVLDGKRFQVSVVPTVDNPDLFLVYESSPDPLSERGSELRAKWLEGCPAEPTPP